MALRKRREPPLDPFERAARRSDPELAQLEPVSDVMLPQLRGKNLLLLFLVLVVVVAVFRDGIGGGRPDIARDCSKPAYAFRDTDIRLEGVLRWSATGPDGASVVFAAGAGAAPGDVLAGPVRLEDCLAGGQFGLRSGPGEQEVSMYLVAADGATTKVGTTTVTVADR